MRRLVRDPLLHFLLLAVLLFAVHRSLAPTESRAEGKIVVTRTRIENLVKLFERTWQRPPTREELNGLIEGYVREEVLYREGVALGLDRDDLVVRQRVNQKLEFIAEDAIDLVAPTDGDLEAYLDAHPEDFAVPPRYTFDHVFLDPLRHPQDLEPTILALQDELARKGDTGPFESLGDATMLPPRYEDLSAGELSKVFGEAFAKGVAALTGPGWQGPLRSGFGLHFVRITARSEGRAPPLDEIREVVEREWSHARRLASKDEFYRELRKRYSVTVEDAPRATRGTP